MVFSCTNTDSTGAESLLTELLYHLPRGWWWLLHEKGEHDNGLAKAFCRPCAEVQALLINAGVLLENGHGYAGGDVLWDEVKIDVFHRFSLPSAIYGN